MASFLEMAKLTSFISTTPDVLLLICMFGLQKSNQV